MKKPFKVHYRGRWRRFATQEAAAAFCGECFRRTGIVLSIVTATPARKRRKNVDLA